MRRAARSHKMKHFFALTLLIICAACSAGCGPSTKTDPMVNVSIIDRLQIEFRKRNPRLDHVDITDLRQTRMGSAFVVVAHAIRKDRSPSEDLSDEMFGVFVCDGPLREISTTLDMFQPVRWNDTEVRITDLAPDTVSITVIGLSQGDVQAVKKYSLQN